MLYVAVKTEPHSGHGPEGGDDMLYKYCLCLLSLVAAPKAEADRQP